MDDLANSLESDVSSAWNTVTTTGAPAVIAGVENYAASQLSASAAQSTAQAQAAVTAAVKNSGNSSGIMASIQSTLNGIAQGTVFKQYGLYIVIGVVAVLVIGRKVL